MKTYDTAVEALNDLYDKGYTTDFSFLKEKDCIYCHASNQALKADEFVIDEVHRFEGDSDPGDEMVVYAISSDTYELKGTLINAFGIYSDSGTSHIIEKLKYRKSSDPQPIKRGHELIALSRRHHRALLLCWKIKQGLSANVELPRIYSYTNWFYKNQLLPEFELEEKYVFPILDNSDSNRKKAAEQHARLRKLFESQAGDKQTLMEIQDLLNEHIRFEERVVFNQAQKKGSIAQLEKIKVLHPEGKFDDNESDPFWKL